MALWQSFGAAIRRDHPTLTRCKGEWVCKLNSAYGVLSAVIFARLSIWQRPDWLMHVSLAILKAFADSNQAVVHSTYIDAAIYRLYSETVATLALEEATCASPLASGTLFVRTVQAGIRKRTSPLICMELATAPGPGRRRT